MKVTDEMVSRFLAWPLPKDFGPDCGISFDGRKPDQWNPQGKGWPIGTNLFTADQARAMLEHVLQCAPSESGYAGRFKCPRCGGTGKCQSCVGTGKDETAERNYEFSRDLGDR